MAALRKPSLQRITTRLHHEHLRRNVASAGLRNGWGRRLLAFVRRHWRVSLLMAIALYGVVGTITALVPPTDYGPQIPGDLTDYFRDLQTINLALLGAQATLLGLVYPLVIALVGMLFETRSSTGHRLQIYFSETEAAPVGGLALAYIAFVALQSLLYAQLELKVVGAITVLNVLWFAVNLLGLAFFVLRSLDFVQPTRRVRLTRSYIANVAWRDQLRSLMLANRWVNAATYKYLPQDPEDSEFTITPFISDKDLVSRDFSRPRRLIDIRFGVLSVALKARAKRALAEDKEIRTTLAGWPDQDYASRAVLVRGVGETNWSERRLFLAAFRFGPVSHRDPIPTTEGLLAEGAADLVSLFDAGRLDDFKARLRELLEQHGLYYQLAQTPQDPGDTPFNYGAMDSGFQTLAMEWVRAYIPLLDRLAEQLSSDPKFLDSAASLAARLQRRVGGAPHEATRALFFPTMYLVRGLLLNATRARVLTSESPPEPTFTFAGPKGDAYARAWQDVVGGWETFADALAPLATNKPAPWPRIRAMAPGLARHLRDTAMMVAVVAQSGETTAIRWTVDLMLKWDERVRRVWPTSGQSWAVERALPTLALTSREWEAVPASLYRHGDRPAEPIDVFDAAIENAWRDTLLVLVCSLIGRSVSPSPGVMNDGAAMAACALFQNREFDTGASYHPRSAPLVTEEILRSILRLVGEAGNDDAAYGRSIEELAEQISRLEGPNYISGRVYGWSGEASLWGQNTTHGLLIAASLNTPSPGRTGKIGVSGTIRTLLLPSSDEARRAIIRHLEGIRDALPHIDRVHGAGIASALTASAIDVPEFEARLERVREWLDYCLAIIQAAREQVLLSAPVDKAALRAISDAAQSRGFSKEAGAFPVSAFAAVDRSSDALKPMVYRQTHVRRGAYVSPPMDDRMGSEGEWWAHELVGRVGEIVLLDVLETSNPSRRSPRSAATYWKALSEALEAVRSTGQSPVVIRPHRQDPKCLWDWTHGHGDRPSDFAFVRQPNGDDSYDFHLNGTPVYSSRAANGATWVFGLERLERLTFRSFGEEGLTTLTLDPDAASPWSASLRLEWGRKVRLSDGPAFRITHPKPSS